MERLTRSLQIMQWTRTCANFESQEHNTTIITTTTTTTTIIITMHIALKGIERVSFFNNNFVSYIYVNSLLVACIHYIMTTFPLLNAQP